MCEVHELRCAGTYPGIGWVCPSPGAIRNASSYVAGNVCKQGDLKHELLFSSRFIRFKCCLLLF